jgi:hypothetical protein
VRTHVDLPTVDALEAEWARHPPVHHLVAAYLGYKAPVQTAAHTVTDIDDMLPALGHVPIRTMPPMDTAAFDAAMQQGAAHG